MFWPQTKVYGDSIVCQPSGPITTNANLFWNISEANLSLEFTPFSNCQGIPIKVISAASTKLDSTVFLIVDDKIMINLENNTVNGNQNLNGSNLISQVNANQTIEIYIEASTDTVIPITATSTFFIDVQNHFPVFQIITDVIKVRISEGLSIKAVYSRFCSSTLALISFDDDEEDSIYFTSSFDNSEYIQSQFVLNSDN